MNKLRIFIFLFFAAILFAACKSIPQAPAEEFTVAESPDVPSAPEEISLPEEMPPAEELSAPEEMPPAENPPTSEGTSLSEETSPSEGTSTSEETSLSAGTALSLPTTEAESAPKNAGMAEEDLPPEKPKTTLSLKPKTSVDSGKTAVPKENAEKLLSARPRLRPRLAPENTVHSESSTDSSAADAMPVASETTALSPASDSEVQVSAATATFQDKVAPKTETADKSELQSVVSPGRIQNIAETAAVPASSSVKPSENASSSSSVFDEPEIVLHADDSTAAENDAQENRDEVLIEPSRVEEAELNQSFNILYEGKNWIFLGEKNPVQPPVVGFLKRSFNGNNTVFSLNALSEGETVLHFYKHDLLENTARDEYVLVKIKAVKPQTDAETSSASSSEVQTVTDTALAESDTQTEAASSPEEVYAQAETAFNETRYADALNILDDFFKNFTPSDNCFDKAVFLKARIYETPSDYRNIRGALDEYKKITAFFPESDLWKDARRRIIYINRFYMDIR
ncbi:MAG: hypothetical protein ACTTKC_04485 [Treponema sp.]|uniref:hypothetical protein n=1 Tax=Treponema sp. TaxID=166 RepID=UPI003FA1F642